MSPDSIASDVRLDSRWTDKEWAERVKLAAAYRLVEHYGWTEQIYGHLTARVPGSDNHFLINPYGLNYEEVTASNLVKIDIEGNPVDGSGSVSYAGFIIHSAVHMNGSAENHVVMHTHTRAGMAVAALEDGLLPLSMFSTAFYGRIGYHDYEGVSLYPNERERIVAAMGPNKACILRNHGLLVVGATVPDCFLRLYRLERACQIQLDAAAAGRLHQIPDVVAKRSQADLDSFQEMHDGDGDGEGEIEFAALMRKLDKIDGSYRF